MIILLYTTRYYVLLLKLLQAYTTATITTTTSTTSIMYYRTTICTTTNATTTIATNTAINTTTTTTTTNYIVRRRYRPVGPPFSSLACWSCRCIEKCLIRGWVHILPGWRWLYEPQQIGNQPVGLGFQHHVGRYRPGGPLFSSPVCFDL